MGPLSRRLSILIYHRVIPQADPLVPDDTTAEEFDWHLRLLRRWFTVLPLREAAARLASGTLPVRAACVTFDDGYADNTTVALPILKKWLVPATFFIATGYLDGGVMWNDRAIRIVRAASGDTLDARCAGLGLLRISTMEERRRAVARILGALKYLAVEERELRLQQLGEGGRYAAPSDLMMTSVQVKGLCESGMEVGAHTVSHPILAGLDPERARIEIVEGRRRLEAITGRPVALFAYPNGRPGVDYSAENVATVRKLGFEAAVSTAAGVAGKESDLFQLPRFTPWDRTPGRFLLRLLQNTFRTRPETV